MADRPGIIALLGAAGVGKTTLLGALAAQFRAQGQAPQLVACGDLLTTPLPPILLVDEADRIEEAMLAALAREDGVAVLAALPGFATRLAGLPHRLVHLGGLLEEEVPAYVAARLATLRLPSDRIAATALAELAEASAGVPRRLNVMIGSSLFMAEMDGATQVSPVHVRAAAEMHVLPLPEAAPAAPGQALVLPPATVPAADAEPAAPPPEAPRRRLGWIIAGVLAVAATALALLPQAPPPAGPAAPLAAAPAAGGVAEPGDPPPPPQPAPPPLDQAPPAAPAAPPPAQPAATPLVEPAATPPVEPTAPLPPEPAAALPPEPAALPPVEPAALPPVEPAARLVLTYPRGDAAAAARSASLAARLREAGVAAGAPFAVSAGGASDQLRYFFPQDRALAEDLAATAGQAAAATLGEVPPGAPLPRPGTLEWAVSANPAAIPPPSAPAPRPPPPALAEPVPSQPPDGAVLPLAAPVRLSWQGLDAAEAGCCFIEVLAQAGESRWQEVFAGVPDAPDHQNLTLTTPGDYAWRVLHVSREGPHYVAAPWSRFTLRPAAP